MDNPDAFRLRVKWDKGRNYFSSFFAELIEVQQSMESKAFEEWCRTQLGLSVGVILTSSKILKSIDAAIIQRNLAAARDEARRQKLIKRRQDNVIKAEQLQEKARLAAEKELEKKRKKKRANDRAYRRRKKLKEMQLSEAAE